MQDEEWNHKEPYVKSGENKNPEKEKVEDEDPSDDSTAEDDDEEFGDGNFEASESVKDSPQG